MSCRPAVNFPNASIRCSFFEKWFAQLKVKVSRTLEKSSSRHHVGVSTSVIEQNRVRAEVPADRRRPLFQVFYLLVIALATLGWLCLIAWCAMVLMGDQAGLADVF